MLGTTRANSDWRNIFITGESSTTWRTSLAGPAEVLGDLLADQAVAHELADLDDELLALALLALAHVVVEALERDDAEGDVARLVLHHVVDDVAHQRLDGQLVHLREGGHGQALDEDLHAEVLQVPAAVADDDVEQLLEVAG